jgi:hypothetical protein
MGQRHPLSILLAEDNAAIKTGAARAGQLGTVRMWPRTDGSAARCTDSYDVI